MSKEKPVYALITGASEGIGRAISIELARRGKNILLVALPDEKLRDHFDYLSGTYGVDVQYYGIDLSSADADLEVYEWVSGQRYRVNILVNNAGYGFLGAFNSYSRDYYQKLLQINVQTVVGLTRLMMDELLQHKKSYILNVGSIASFYPMPYKIVYAASKYFIYSFTRALREELKKTPVRVSLLCPGPVKTNNDVITRINAAGWLGRLSSLTPEYVAKVSIRRLFRNKSLTTPGLLAKVYYYFEKISPTFIKQLILAQGFRPVENKKEKIQGRRAGN
ncbi:MAG: SDR family NAD(P)-dependent oxidoreductase [Bacteroidales bacterium]|nr:SDR family NAD(P)-dependent oxidoreductase [Bacteroidales bacterium]